MPGNKCSIAGCTNCSYSQKTSSGIKYHSFPKDEKRRKLWIKMCGRDENWNPRTGYVCSEHFKSEDYETMDLKAELLNIPLKRKLKPTAIPVPFTKGISLDKNNAASLNEIQTSNPYLFSNPEIPVPFTETTSKKDIHLKRNDTVSNLSEISSSFSKPSVDNPALYLCTNASVQTDIHFNVDHYNDNNLQQRILDVETQLKTCDKIIQNLKSENETLRSKLTKEINTATSRIDKYHQILNAVRQAFTQNQIDIISKNKKKVVWTNDEISKAFTLRYYSKRAYLYLRDTLKYPLPAISTLQRWASKMNMRQGILYNVLFMMKVMKDDMTEFDKCTVLQFDEMKVQTIYEYDKEQDEVIGPHSYMQVVMARGLFGRWKQPIFVDFDKKMTKEILYKVIDALEKLGYPVVACVSDCGGGNIGLWKELDISYNKTFCQDLSNGRIYFFADIPHLLKLLRNWLLDTGFILEDGTIINKDPFKALIAATDTEVNSCYKLTKDHIDCVKTQRQNVTLATQLLSHTVGTALVHYQPGSDKQLAINTGKFVLKISAWFDVMNSYTPSSSLQSKKPYGMDLEYQISVLDTAYHLISTMRCIGKSSLQLFQKGILMSITSLKLLFDDMRAKFSIKYILTHRLNQDCLENFFSQIRSKGGLHDHPSPLNALYRLRMIVLGKNPGVVQTRVNVEDASKDEFIVCKVLEVANISVMEELTSPPIEEESDNDTSTSLSSGLSIINCETENDGLIYLAGWIARKFKNKYPNLGCYSGKNNIHNYALPSWIQHLSFGGLMEPTKEWMDNVHLLNKEFIKYHRHRILKPGKKVTQRLVDKIVKKYNTQIPIDLIASFVKQRTFIRIKFRNMKLKDKKDGIKRKLEDLKRKSGKKYRKIIH